VVSVHIRGETNTMPLHVEIVYSEYKFRGGLRVASLLAILALLTLLVKTWIEWRAARPATKRLRRQLVRPCEAASGQPGEANLAGFFFRPARAVAGAAAGRAGALRSSRRPPANGRTVRNGDRTGLLLRKKSLRII
jgi:hypothetical protein